MQEIFTMKNFIIYIISINLIGFFIMWLDKHKARKGSWRIPEKTLFIITVWLDKHKARKGSWRIPEKTLFIITAIGGGIGTTTGMFVFRHKTKKLNFLIGFPFITILEIILAIYYLLIK